MSVRAPNPEPLFDTVDTFRYNVSMTKLKQVMVHVRLNLEEKAKVE